MMNPKKVTTAECMRASVNTLKSGIWKSLCVSIFGRKENWQDDGGNSLTVMNYRGKFYVIDYANAKP